jgi:hypothetical protein
MFSPRYFGARFFGNTYFGTGNNPAVRVVPSTVVAKAKRLSGQPDPKRTKITFR